MSSKRPKPETRKTQRPPSVRNQRFALVAASLFVSTNLCIFGPFEIVTSNPAEFDVTFAEMVPRLIVLLLGLGALLSLPGLWAPARVRSRITSVLLAIGVLLWIQGSFLKWGYGDFDGKGIDWAAFSWQGWVDLFIWVTLAGAACRFSARISRQASVVAIGFILLQSGFLVARTVTSSPPAASRASGSGTKTVPQALCQLSSSRNVFHFVMDAFQTDIFLELVEEDDLADVLDGFVLYTDNMSTGSQTVLSLPALFSTRVYDGTVRQSEYFREAIKSSFHTVLYQNGYVVNLTPHITMDSKQSTTYFDCPRTYASPPGTRMMQALTYALDVSMFRQFPHFAKRVVYNDQNWRLSSIVDDPPNHVSFHQKAFFRDYTSKLEIAYTEPAYHFMHLMPPHGPFVTLADGSYAGEALPNTRENYKNEARYMLRLFVEFLDKLKDMGLYDQAIILLHGDHGLGMTAEVAPAPFQKRISWFTALLVLKEPLARGPLRLSKAQTSLSDVPATMMDILGIQHAYPGESIVDLSPGEMRTRRVVILGDKAAREPLLNRWIVRGSVADSTSWQELESRVVKYDLRPYQWGTRVRFGIAHEGDVYLKSGWSTTSPNYTWNDGEFAEVVFGIEAPESDVSVFIAMFAYIVPGKVDRQRVRIWVNDFSLGEKTFTAGKGQALQANIPRAALQSDRMVVRFELPDAVAPRDIGAGPDSRELAIGLYSFEARPLPDR